MSDPLMDEFARFQAELQSLEADADTSAAAPAPPAASAKPAAPSRAVASVICRPATAPAAGPSVMAEEYAPHADYYDSQGQQGQYGAYSQAFPPFMPPQHAQPQATFRDQAAPPRLPPGNVLQQGVPRAVALRQPGAVAVVPVRSAAGEKWVDLSMAEWPEDDHRIFVGDLGKEVSDEMLARAFSKYPSFQKAKTVRQAKTGEHKGYGFVSFGTIADMVKAIKEMDGKYIGNRPCKLKKSTWQTRDAGVAAVQPGRRIKTHDLTAPHRRKHVSVLER